jgi:hypothetical protein
MADGQLAYMDESGDAGFKVESGSSPTLVVAAVILDSAQDAEATASAIHRYREILGKGRSFQFHFSNLRRDWRVGFLEAVRDCPFRVRAIVMPKDHIWEGTQLRKSGEYFYNFTMKMLLTHTFGDIENAKLFVDGEAGRQSLRRMVAYLRRECNTPECRVFRDIKFVPKRESNVLVQLADMVTGSVARFYRYDKTDRQTYRAVIESKLRVWEFGKPKG